MPGAAGQVIEYRGLYATDKTHGGGGGAGRKSARKALRLCKKQFAMQRSSVYAVSTSPVRQVAQDQLGGFVLETQMVRGVMLWLARWIAWCGGCEAQAALTESLE